MLLKPHGQPASDLLDRGCCDLSLGWFFRAVQRGLSHRPPTSTAAIVGAARFAAHAIVIAGRLLLRGLLALTLAGCFS